MSEPAGRPADAFGAGFAPQVAGLYFNGLILLDEMGRGAEGRLATLVGEERERVVGRREAALARMEETDDRLARLGARPVSRPDGAGEYTTWTEAIFDTVRDVMASDSPEAVAHLLGWVLGEAIATLDVVAILSRLREIEPEHLWMRLQGDSLERERQTAERRLSRLAAHPLLPEPVQVATALAAHAVAEGAPSGGYAGRAARAETAVVDLGEQATAITDSLAR
jgi:hypothetical protein